MDQVISAETLQTAQRRSHGEYTAGLARYAAEFSYERVPGEGRDFARGIVLDTLGVTLAANTLGSGCRELVEVARATGGAPDSRLLGFGDRVPVLMSSLINGAMSHALNYDDTSGAGGVHLGPTSLPTAMAAAAMRSVWKFFITA